MADGTSPRFDRVDRPDAQIGRPRGRRGTDALYSTAPGAAPAFPVRVLCGRCHVERGVRVPELLRVLRPPMLLNPLSRRVLGRCPTCRRRAWLRLRAGEPMRMLLNRRPAG